MTALGGVALIYVGRNDNPSVAGVVGVGWLALALYSWRTPPRTGVDRVLLAFGLCATVIGIGLAALLLVVVVGSHGCLYGYYEPGQCQ